MTFEKVISNLHVQESKFGTNIYKFGGKSNKKENAAEFMEFFFHACAYYTLNIVWIMPTDIHTSLFTLLYAHWTICAALYTLHFTHCTLHTVLLTLQYAHCTMHIAHCILHTALYTLHYSHCTMCTALCTIKYALYTLNTTLCTLHYTWWYTYALYTALCTLHYAHCTMNTALWNMSTLPTEYFAVQALCPKHPSLDVNV